MRNYEEALKLLLFLSNDIAKLTKARKEIERSGLSQADKYEKVDRLDNQVQQIEKERVEVLCDLVRYPPHFLLYAPLIDKFQQSIKQAMKPGTTCRGSVFIMTKYPDGEDAQRDTELQMVIDTVKKAVADCQYHPALADDIKLHDNLWENVECQMLACSRGIAIVESKFKPDLNPNVAMEWGWMRAMRKPVLYLVEKDVKVVPADVSGLIRGRFEWLKPEIDIPEMVAKELD